MTEPTIEQQKGQYLETGMWEPSFQCLRYSGQQS